MEMSASRFPTEAERAASGVAPLSKAVRQMAIFCRPFGRVRHRFGNLCHAAATAPVQVSAMRLMDITDDEGASLIRPVICHPHQPIIPRVTKHSPAPASTESAPEADDKWSNGSAMAFCLLCSWYD
jgi:hypothetical protein